MLRDQIVGSCRLIMRHAEGLIVDAMAITELPNYKCEAEDSLNKTERVIAAAAQAIKLAKEQMGKKQLEAAQ